MSKRQIVHYNGVPNVNDFAERVIYDFLHPEKLQHIQVPRPYPTTVGEFIEDILTGANPQEYNAGHGPSKYYPGDIATMERPDDDDDYELTENRDIDTDLPSIDNIRSVNYQERLVRLSKPLLLTHCDNIIDVSMSARYLSNITEVQAIIANFFHQRSRTNEVTITTSSIGVALEVQIVDSINFYIVPADDTNIYFGEKRHQRLVRFHCEHNDVKVDQL